MNAPAKLVLAFLMIIVGVALLGQIASSGQDITTRNYQSDSLNVSTAILGAHEINTTLNFTALQTYPYLTNWKNGYSDCQITTLSSVGNTTATYTVTTDYVYTASTNTLAFQNTSAVWDGGQIVRVAYTYCPDTYLTQGWSRTTINLVPGLFAIALLLVGVGLFYSLGKDAGIIS